MLKPDTGKVCPKCAHAREETADAPDWQCPNCGIAYIKFEAGLRSRQLANKAKSDVIGLDLTGLRKFFIVQQFDSNNMPAGSQPNDRPYRISNAGGQIIGYAAQFHEAYRYRLDVYDKQNLVMQGAYHRAGWLGNHFDLELCSAEGHPVGLIRPRSGLGNHFDLENSVGETICKLRSRNWGLSWDLTDTQGRKIAKISKYHTGKLPLPLVSLQDVSLRVEFMLNMLNNEQRQLLLAAVIHATFVDLSPT